MKKYILIAGVNGAGKSTLYQTNSGLQGIPRVNTDEILREFGDWKNINDVFKAGTIALKKITQYFSEGITFNQETTLCGNAVLKYINKAKEAGYLIEIHYVGVDSVEIAKERVRQRVLDGGHGIDEEDIERRYYESFKQMNRILKECDLVVFYDNTKDFRRFAFFQRGKVRLLSRNIPKWFEEYIEY